MDKTPAVYNKSDNRHPKSVYFNSTVKFYEGGFSEGNYNGRGVLVMVSLCLTHNYFRMTKSNFENLNKYQKLIV